MELYQFRVLLRVVFPDGDGRRQKGMVYMVWYIRYGVYGMVYMVWYMVNISWMGLDGMENHS